MRVAAYGWVVVILALAGAGELTACYWGDPCSPGEVTTQEQVDRMVDCETVEDVRSIIVNPGGERPIRLASVAEVTLGEGPSEVRRIDARRVAVLNANIAEGSLSGASQRIAETLNRKIDWPESMTYFIAGQNEEWQAITENASRARQLVDRAKGGVR